MKKAQEMMMIIIISRCDSVSLMPILVDLTGKFLIQETTILNYLFVKHTK